MLKIVKADLDIDLVSHVSNLLKGKSRKTVVISANKRPIRFIEQNLSPEDTLNADFFTIDEFARSVVVNLSDKVFKFQKKIERELFFLNLLYGYADENRYFLKVENPLELFFWAGRLSHLFDEVDRQLLGDKLSNFDYVEGVREAQIILGGLKELYSRYEREYEDYMYAGKTLKMASELSSERQFGDIYGEFDFIYIGFVYLSNAELEILKGTASITDCTFFLQTDLMNRDRGFSTFKVVDRTVERIKKTLAYHVSLEELKPAKTSETDFKILEFGSELSELRSCAETVKELSKGFKDITNPKNIAVILPKNHAVVPFLSFLGEKDIPLNITMSFPFSTTQLGLFISSLFDCLLNVRTEGSENKICLNPNLLLRLLNSSFIEFFSENIRKSCEYLKEKLLKNRFGLFCLSNSTEREKVFIERLIKPFLNIKSFQDAQLAFSSLFNYLNWNRLKSDRLVAHTVQFFSSEVASTLNEAKSRFYVDLKLIAAIVKQVLEDIYVPFEGHPLEGVQVMGMLESRMLKFDTVVFVDVNEGVLPSPERIDPLMPEDIKRALGLSSYREKEELVRYNFFRLAYSSNRCFISFVSSASSDSRSLKSRFVEQVVVNSALKGEKIEPLKSGTETGFERIDDRGVMKNGELTRRVERLIERGLSPTAIDMYMNCPYSFYLKYVREVPEALNLDDELDASPIGSLVHLILKRGFEQFVGREISTESLRKIEKTVDSLVERIKSGEQGFGDRYVDDFLGSLNSFRREALYEVIKFRLGNFFKKHKEKWPHFTLFALERELKSEKLHLKGILDRVDLIGDRVRIVDYKTGKKPKKPRLSDFEVLFGDDGFIYDKGELERVREHVRSVQLPAYLLLADELFKKEEYEAFLVLLGRTEELFDGFKADSKDLKSYKRLIEYLFNHMRGAEYFYPIAGSHCRYCDYLDICKYSKI